MNPPLLEVCLTIHFSETSFPLEKLQYFHHSNRDILPHYEKNHDIPGCTLFSEQRTEGLVISREYIQFLSTSGTSFPKLRAVWERLIENFLDLFQISEVKRISLLYLNEIELQDLRSFRNHLNISFDMPQPLMERIEFFRSEFTYKYDFGEIHVWLQPDWEEKTESYCIQLSLESRHVGEIPRPEVVGSIQKLHEGIKDAFHQILSRDYIERLPQ